MKNVVLTLVFAMTACTALARMAAEGLSAKSYYIDTRHPIVALSDSMGLDTNPGGSYIIIR